MRVPIRDHAGMHRDTRSNAVLIEPSRSDADISRRQRDRARVDEERLSALENDMAGLKGDVGRILELLSERGKG